MVRVQQAKFEQTIAAEFQMMHRELTSYFKETLNHLISNVMKSDGDDDNIEQRQIGK